MGRRGPAPEPTRLKLARGETRPSRLNTREPRPRNGPPVAPSDLDPAARTVWRRVVRDMPKGVITRVDADTLRCFCEAVTRYAEASRLLTQTGLIVRGQHNELVKSPVHQILRDHRDAIRLFGRELGMSPSARAGLKMEVASYIDDDMWKEIGPPPRLRFLAAQDG
jgi:P27 family predicted phage terminase small subunit